MSESEVTHTQFRPSYISDAVHASIPHTAIERMVLDHPIAQRLRRVHQTGLSSYVYPELTHTRFSHCLGSMHLASRFFRASLRNTSAVPQGEVKNIILADIRRLYKANQAAYRHPAGTSDSTLASAIRSWSPHMEDSNTQHVLRGCEIVDMSETGSQELRGALYLAEQGLRLASLFHDLGHLPFSHTFEDAMSDAAQALPLKEEVPERAFLKAMGAWRGKKRLHEVLGETLGRYVLVNELAAKRGANEFGYDVGFLTFICDIALEISRADPDPDPNKTANGPGPGFCMLKSIISGDLDVDRADFILRDGQRYDFRDTDYNVERLLQHIVFAKNSQDCWRLAIAPQAISYLESFLIARYRTYQYGVRHHKTVQVATALQQLLRISVKIAYLSEDIPEQCPGTTPASEIKQFAEDLLGIKRYYDIYVSDSNLDDAGSDSEEEVDDSLFARFGEYDDYWMTTFLRRLKYPQSLADKGNSEKPEDELYEACRGLVWSRERDIVSLWKRPLEFQHLLEGIAASPRVPNFPATIQAWNIKMETIKEEDLAQVRRDLLVEGIIFSIYPNTPYTFGDEIDGAPGSERLLVSDRRGDDTQVLFASQISSTLPALADASMRDVRILAFAPKSKIENDDARKEMAEMVLKKLWDQIRH